MKKLSRLVFTALLITACGGEGPTQPKIKNVTGTWTLVETVSNGGNSCNIAATMVLTQSGNTFSGNYNNGTIICNGVTQGTGITGTVVNGTAGASAVAFDLDNSNAHHIGSVDVTNSTMSGSATWNLSGTIVSGNWQAAK